MELHCRWWFKIAILAGRIASSLGWLREEATIEYSIWLVNRGTFFRQARAAVADE